MVNLRLVLQVPDRVDAHSVILSDRSGPIEKTATKADKLVIQTKIKLPNTVYIQTLDHNIILKELWLGNIQATNSMLNQICCYSTDKFSKYTTHWLAPGTVKIEFFDRTFIEFHLHYGNTLYSGS